MTIEQILLFSTIHQDELTIDLQEKYSEALNKYREGLDLQLIHLSPLQ